MDFYLKKYTISNYYFAKIDEYNKNGKVKRYQTILLDKDGTYIDLLNPFRAIQKQNIYWMHSISDFVYQTPYNLDEYVSPLRMLLFLKQCKNVLINYSSFLQSIQYDYNENKKR